MREVSVLWRLIGRMLAFLGLLLAGPAPASAEPRAAATAAPRPALWVLEDADTRIYLFGTTHVFHASLEWRSAALNRAIAESDELVMETPDASAAEGMDPERLMAPMQMGKSIPILERVSPAARPRLHAALEATGMPMAYFDSLHTWAVAFMLAGYQIAAGAAEQDDRSDGAAQLSGAEEELGAVFRSRKRPISGVETVEEQLGIFANMPQGAQRRFLEMTVGSGAEAEAEAAASAVDLAGDAWVNGNVEAIAAEMASMPAELYDALLTRRNRNWTGWLVRRLERPGTVLFAVGAGHLAGPQSVQRMLAAQGLEARRID